MKILLYLPGVIWFGLCSLAGLKFLEFAFRSSPGTSSALFPFLILLWVAILIAGQYLLLFFAKGLLRLPDGTLRREPYRDRMSERAVYGHNSHFSPATLCVATSTMVAVLVVQMGPVPLDVIVQEGGHRQNLRFAQRPIEIHVEAPAHVD